MLVVYLDKTRYDWQPKVFQAVTFPFALNTEILRTPPAAAAVGSTAGEILGPMHALIAVLAYKFLSDGAARSTVHIFQHSYWSRVDKQSLTRVSTDDIQSLNPYALVYKRLTHNTPTLLGSVSTGMLTLTMMK